MTDTIRERTTIASLLADNTSSEISPQDLRDTVVSIWGVFGSISTYNNASSQSLTTTPAKITAFDITGSAVGVTADASTDDITVSSGSQGTFLVYVTLTCSGMTLNTLYSFHVAKNGTRVNGASGAINVQSSNDVGNVTIIYTVALTAGDIISVLGESTVGGGANITIKHGQLSIQRIY